MDTSTHFTNPAKPDHWEVIEDSEAEEAMDVDAGLRCVRSSPSPEPDSSISIVPGDESGHIPQHQFLNTNLRDKSSPAPQLEPESECCPHSHYLNHLQNEVKRLQEDRAFLLKTLDEDRNKWKAEMLLYASIIDEKDDSIREMEDVIHERDARIHQMKTVTREQDAVIREKDDKIRRRDDTIRKRDDTIHRREDTIRNQNSMIQERDTVIATMKEQESELRRTLLFLTSEDRCSATDITSLVKALNYEVLQLSTAMAEEIAGKATKNEAEAVGKKEASERLERYISAQICHELEAANLKEDCTLLQLIFQAVLCCWCKHFIESWDRDAIQNLTPILSGLYAKMKEKEPQSIFSQWRALTQRQVNDLMTKYKPKPITDKIGNSIADVMTVANHQHPKQTEGMNTFFADKIRDLESHVDRIRKAITLEFISGDFTMIFVRAGEIFNSKKMRDAFESSKHSKDDQVACATELGLLLTKKVTKGDESHRESLLLLPPQVFLHSTLAELVRSGDETG